MDEDDEDRYVEIEEVAAVGKRVRESSSGGSGRNRTTIKKVRVKGKLRKKRRNPLEIVMKPPRMMENEIRWDYVKAIRDTPLAVTVGQVLSVSPAVRAGLAYSMIVPKERRKDRGSTTAMEIETPTPVNSRMSSRQQGRPTSITIEDQQEKTTRGQSRKTAEEREQEAEKSSWGSRKIAQPVGVGGRTRAAIARKEKEGETRETN